MDAPYKPVVSYTLSRWLKSVLHMSGIDRYKYFQRAFIVCELKLSKGSVGLVGVQNFGMSFLRMGY